MVSQGLSLAGVGRCRRRCSLVCSPTTIQVGAIIPQNSNLMSATRSNPRTGQTTRNRKPYCGDRRSILLTARSRQQSYFNLTSVEIYLFVSSTLKHQCCRKLCLWKFVSLHPICKIQVHLRPECFLSIRQYASYYRLPFWRMVVVQYFELETLPFLNFLLHFEFLICSPHSDH